MRGSRCGFPSRALRAEDLRPIYEVGTALKCPELEAMEPDPVREAEALARELLNDGFAGRPVGSVTATLMAVARECRRLRDEWEKANGRHDRPAKVAEGRG